MMMKQQIAFVALLSLTLSWPAIAHDEGHVETQVRGQAQPRVQGDADDKEAKRPRIGGEVKDFTLTDSAGDEFRLSDLRTTEESEGKITVLTFWCTMCHSCRDIDGDFDRKAAKYKDQGVRFFAVASNYTESADRVNDLLKVLGLKFPVLMDSQSAIARYFGAAATTTTAVIDAEGRLRYYGRFKEAEQAIGDLLGGREVAAPETPPFGCAIMLKPGEGAEADGADAGHGHGGHARNRRHGDHGHDGHDSKREHGNHGGG